MIETLAWLHSIDPDTIGLSGFGKKTGFYQRHCNTFSRIEAQQAKVRDIKTGRELGRAHEHYDEIVDFVRHEMTTERYAVVHGDFKFDNVVSTVVRFFDIGTEDSLRVTVVHVPCFDYMLISTYRTKILHPTEPRVIAILDWELSTIGNPLMDAVYVISPFWITFAKAHAHEGVSSAVNATSTSAPNVGVSSTPPSSSPYSPSNRAASGMPSPDALLDRYASITGFDPRLEGVPPGKDFEIAKIFHHVRGGTISHGIQARTYAGQASSDFSHVYFRNTRMMLDEAWDMVQKLKSKGKESAEQGRAKL